MSDSVEKLDVGGKEKLLPLYILIRVLLHLYLQNLEFCSSEPGPLTIPYPQYNAGYNGYMLNE